MLQVPCVLLYACCYVVVVVVVVVVLLLLLFFTEVFLPLQRYWSLSCDHGLHGIIVS